MKPKFYPLLLRCIEDGTSAGYYRAHKHTDTPCEALVTGKIVDAITEQLYEAFDIDDTCNEN